MSETNGVRGKLTRPPAASGGGKPPLIFLATPMYGGMASVSYVHGLEHLCRILTVSGLQYHTQLMYNEALITRARNRIVMQFLKSEATHLFFIDADIGFSARDAKCLLEADLDVACGCYPMKNYGWEAVVDAVKAGKEAGDLAVAGARYAVNATPAGTNGALIQGFQKAGATFIEVQDAATGFLLIKREVIEALIKAFGKELEYIADYEPDVGQTHYKLFQADSDPTSPRELAKFMVLDAIIRRDDEALATAAEKYREAYELPPGRYLSEDYYFSRLWQRMGGKIYACLDCKLTHTGMHTWRGNLKELWKPEEVPAAELEVAAG